MKLYEKKILDKRLPDFVEEVVPVDLLPYLSCLTKPDKEAIEAQQNNHGPTRATDILVDRLKRREKGFSQFVLALRKCGSGHTALLLDPFHDIEDDTADVEVESGLGFRKMGTAIDIHISGNLRPAQDEEESENCKDLERHLAKNFENPTSPASKKIRREIRKELPDGTEFVHTKHGSIITTFRLSRVSAATQLWELYTDGKLQSILQRVLVDSTLAEQMKTPEKPLELRIDLVEERFNTIKEKLQAIETEQEIKESGCFLSCPSRKQGEAAVDDFDMESEIEIDIPPVYLENGTPLGSPELILRDYQCELAEPVLQGKNTIICAPTNSGKTFVAIEIARNHLESFSKDKGASGQSEVKREPRVVFIVSTVNLVLQQKERFDLYLGDKYSVSEISGANATEIPLKYLLQSHHVLIMTAQILVNALNSSNKEQRVQLREISLLIFDECHHAQKEHSYNRVMESYLTVKMQPGRQDKLPQIVGLTASLGTGKAKTLEKAKDHIILLCANLDAEVISTVRKHQSELKKFANVPTNAVFQVAKCDRDPFERIINQVMDKIHEGVRRLHRNKTFKVPPPDKDGQQYRQWVEELYKDSVGEADRFLVTYAEHLREYHIALTINTNTTMKNAVLRLTGYFDSLDEERFTETDRNLRRLFNRAMEVLNKYVQDKGEPQNPRLLKLQQLLLDNYKDVARQREEEQEEISKESTGDSRAIDRKLQTSRLDKTKSSEEEGGVGDDTQKPEQADGEEKGDDHQESRDGQTAENQAQDSEVIPESAEEAEGQASSTGKTEHANADAEKESEENSSNSLAADTQETNDTDPVQENVDPIENSGPKGILFTRTRESTEALLDWIKDTDELNTVLRPEVLVGSGDGTIGMTQREQEKVIKRFQTGEKNLLLATSVAEEGLDISDCNFVIRYDMMGNEISSVQSRGRVRAEEGKYNVVVSMESGARKREDTNRYRECLMVEALRKVQELDSSNFIKTVRGVQFKSFQDRYLKKHVFASHKTANVPDNVSFRCRKCNVDACQAQDIRRIKENYHVVISSDFKTSKVALEPLSKPKKVDGILMAKRIFCSECKEDWGVTAFIDGVEWMCIKPRGFVFEDKSGDSPKRVMYRKWKEVPFEIPEATLEELLQETTDHQVPDFLDDANLLLE